jgi:hypothetical protein
MKFKLTIELGNSAMLTYPDICRALIHTINRIQRDRGGLPNQGDAGEIQDLNGNSVGRWRMTGKR